MLPAKTHNAKETAGMELCTPTQFHEDFLRGAALFQPNFPRIHLGEHQVQHSKQSVPQTSCWAFFPQHVQQTAWLVMEEGGTSGQADINQNRISQMSFTDFWPSTAQHIHEVKETYAWRMAVAWLLSGSKVSQSILPLNTLLLPQNNSPICKWWLTLQSWHNYSCLSNHTKKKKEKGEERRGADVPLSQQRFRASCPRDKSRQQLCPPAWEQCHRNWGGHWPSAYFPLITVSPAQVTMAYQVLRQGHCNQSSPVCSLEFFLVIPIWILILLPLNYDNLSILRSGRSRQRYPVRIPARNTGWLHLLSIS